MQRSNRNLQIGVVKPELVKTDIKTLEVFMILKRNVGYFLYRLAKIKGDIKNAPQRALVNFLIIKINCL